MKTPELITTSSSTVTPSEIVTKFATLHLSAIEVLFPICTNSEIPISIVELDIKVFQNPIILNIHEFL